MSHKLNWIGAALTNVLAARAATYVTASATQADTLLRWVGAPGQFETSISLNFFASSSLTTISTAG